MKKRFIYLFLLIILIPFDSTAELHKKATIILDGIPNNWPDVKLRAWTGVPQTEIFKLGDEMKFYFHTERNCYISLFYIDSRGIMTVISPDLGNGSNFVEAGKEATFPPDNANYQITVEPPLGQDNVYVVATNNRVDLPEDGTYADSTGIAKEISLALRENKNVPKTAMVKLQITVQGRSKEIEYRSQDIVSYFRKTRALRPTLTTEQPRMFLEVHVRFDFDSAKLTSEAKKSLDEFGKSLQNPSLAGERFIIAGHTDDVGSYDYNMTLSRRRAESVKQYLVSQHGINPSILQTKAYGETSPFDPRKTEAARNVNRRVEFELTP